MYAPLLAAHSVVRWLLLICMLYAIYRNYTGYAGNKPFSRADNALRHWTATISHIQLMIGMLVYLKSPLVAAFWKNKDALPDSSDFRFFSIIHISLMFAAILVLTIGSAKAKREKDDKMKFRTMLRWFTFALFILLVAIPWPFSPLAQRPLFRSF